MPIAPNSLTRRIFLVPAAILAAAAPAPASERESRAEPFDFFEGRTEMVSVVKVIMRKPYRSRTLGQGQILSDGSLALVQRVLDEGKPAGERRWRIRQVGAKQFAGTMSEATGPVTVQEVSGKYRFRFKMKGNLEVDQWLTPLPGGTAAHSRATVKKFGMRVASSEGMIRKLQGCASTRCWQAQSDD